MWQHVVGVLPWLATAAGGGAGAGLLGRWIFEHWRPEHAKGWERAAKVERSRDRGLVRENALHRAVEVLLGFLDDVLAEVGTDHRLARRADRALERAETILNETKEEEPTA